MVNCVNSFLTNRNSGSVKVRKFGLVVGAVAAFVCCSSAATAQCAAEGGNSLGFDMAPETSQQVVEDAVKQIPTPMAPGPVKPSWQSLKENYKVPDWFKGAKFGIFMHFGIFSVPAHATEWYEKFLYAGGDDSVLKVLGGNDLALGANNGPNSTRAWHAEHFGPIDKLVKCPVS
jgi:alpha-L-fucosidase